MAIGREIQMLTEALLSKEKLSKGFVRCNAPDVDIKAMKRSGSYYLIAINAQSTRRQHIPFHLESIGSSKLTILFEDERMVAVKDGTFHDDFGPHEVHVYSWAE
jgi:hypothetical protein